MNARNVVLYLGGAVVMLAVIGAIYLEILVQARSSHDVWMVTEPVAAGAPLTSGNVRRVSLPDTGDRISYYGGNPVADGKRAGHSLDVGHMIAADDLLTTRMVLVPVNFKAAPPLNRGDVIDVYTQLGAKTVQVGRSLDVESPTTIWVPAVDEPAWITLQANNAPLYAASSIGIGVPATTGLGIGDAVASLSGVITGGQSLGPALPAPTSTPAPTATPPPTPTPKASPTR